VAKAIAPEVETIDVFQAGGLKQPDTSILSDQFLAEVRGLKYKNVAAELRAKQEPHYSIQHELRFIALFLVAAVRAGHNKGLVTTAPKVSKR
jgi:Type I restriction enzyme HindI endonuclease subunit-like, C-terminal